MIPKRWLAPVDERLLAALGYVVATDLLLDQRDPPVIVAGALDELAHLASTTLLAAGLGAPRDAPWLLGAALGSVALDRDHVPGVFGPPITGTRSERPFTHSFPALLAAGLVAARTRGRRGRAARGFGCGLASHLFRDFASGACGVPFWWPLSRRDVRLPRWLYLGTLAALLWTASQRRATLGRNRETD